MEITKEKAELINQIVKKADGMGILMFDRLSLWMDLECTNKEFNLRLEELLHADDFNFIHDICGIQRHLDRRKKEMGDLFIPRFAGAAVSKKIEMGSINENYQYL